MENSFRNQVKTDKSWQDYSGKAFIVLFLWDFPSLKLLPENPKRTEGPIRYRVCLYRS